MGTEADIALLQLDDDIFGAVGPTYEEAVFADEDVTKIDVELLRRLCLLQCSYAELAAVLGVTQQFLFFHFRAPIAYYREQGKTSLRRAMWKEAMGGDRQMMIWLSKQFLGMKEPKLIFEKESPTPQLSENAKAVVDEAVTQLQQLFEDVAQFKTATPPRSETALLAAK